MTTEYLSLGEDAYWQNTGRYTKLANPQESFGDDADPEIVERYNDVHARYFPLDERDDDDTPVALVVSWPAGTRLPLHAHDCDILFVVVRGSFYVPGRVLRPGDICYATKHEFYGPMLVGPDGATAIEIFGAARGVGIEYQMPNDEVLSWDAFSDETRPSDVGYEGIAELEAAVGADQARAG